MILASKSYWRKELLSWLGLEFEVVESGFDEAKVGEQDPEKLAEVLAWQKAMKVAKKLGESSEWKNESQNHRVNRFAEDMIVIGADTIVVIEGKNVGEINMLGKPKDVDHARVMLKQMSGSRVKVVTGVAVVEQKIQTAVKQSNRILTEVDVSWVEFKDMSEEIIEEYLASGESVGKAGAFGILGKAIEMIEGVEGSISGVIGLPLLKTMKMLEKVDVKVNADLNRVVKEKLLSEFERRNPEARLKVED